MPNRQPKTILETAAKSTSDHNRRQRRGALVLFVACLVVVVSAIGYYGYTQFEIYRQQQIDINSLDHQGTVIERQAQKQTRGTTSAINLQDQQLKTIGAVMIPKIALRLPIFSNSSDAALEIGAGWLPASSPLGGGAGTHAVIDGHSGKTKPLFTWISDLRNGDKIYLKAGKKMLEYQVINRAKQGDGVHAPTYVNDLTPKKGQDLLTLITCYPLLQNKQRLHVTAKRVPYDGRQKQVSIWAYLMNYRLELMVAIILLVIPLVAFIITKWRKKGNNATK
jgi:LPXTG-site transpeptidase (sortase) family protein